MTYSIGTEHPLDPANPSLCRGDLKHVIRKETRPTQNGSKGFYDERHVCQRCSGVALDWDGPFDPTVRPTPLSLEELIRRSTTRAS